MRHASMFTAHSAGPMLLGAAVLSASLLARSLIAPATHAAVGGCRSDPTMLLSDGTTLDLSATINDAQQDVQQVSYSVHAPSGTSVTSFVSTDGPMGLVERFRFYADNPANTYTVYTQVSTGTSGVGVTAATTAVSASATSSASASGQSQQALLTNVSG